MTIFGRDASDFDASVSYGGLSFFTHKATEGTTVQHKQYGSRLNAAKAAGVPVLGSYHVVRTPGSGGAGSLAQQLAYWVAYQDAQTPWWRSWPHWVMQIDAEKWPYDPDAPSNVLAFADLLVRSGLPGWKVTYASRGQYADSLRGLVTPLWNANYNGSVGGSYPGDSYPGWTAYSGQTPVIDQYTSTPYDRNAFRGSLSQLLALTAGVPAPAHRSEISMIQVKQAGGPTIVLTDWATWHDQSHTFDQLQAMQAAGMVRVEVDGPTLTRILALPQPPLAELTPVTVDASAVASAVASALAGNTVLLAALAKAVNDDAAARLAH